MKPDVLIVYLEREKFTAATYNLQMQHVQRIAESFERTVYLSADNVGSIFGSIRYDRCICITTSVDLSRQLDGMGYVVVGFETYDMDMMKAPYVILGLEEIEYEDLHRVYQRQYDEPWHILDTPRCTVREFGMDDLAALERMYDIPGFTEFVEPLFAHELEREYERNYIDNIYSFYGFGMWLVFDRTSGELIGRAGIEYRDTCGENEVELGYAIVPQKRRMGIATEVCRAIIDYARDEFDLRSVICRVSVDNIISQKFIAKLGFTVRESDEENYIYEMIL